MVEMLLSPLRFPQRGKGSTCYEDPPECHPERSEGSEATPCQKGERQILSAAKNDMPGSFPYDMTWNGELTVWFAHRYQQVYNRENGSGLKMVYYHALLKDFLRYGGTCVFTHE